jgi:glycosyltransferase involved in cell wall biosynthesis
MRSETALLQTMKRPKTLPQSMVTRDGDPPPSVGTGPKTGVVIIGRNEGERLKNCLRSLGAWRHRAVYVDSGSTDGSLEFAAEMGVHVVNLDLSKRFTAARARNAGFAALLNRHPDLEFVQFVDGDCTLNSEWIGKAQEYLETHRDIGVVLGRRREIHPERSVYNWLCDVEWDIPVGEIEGFGGDVLMRTQVYRDAGGYRDDILAAEDSEFSIRIRQFGWKIMRIDGEMTMHDVAMTKFSQWWQRSKRGGYGMSRVFYIHRDSPYAMFGRNIQRIALFGLVLPLVILICGLINPWFFLLALIYPLFIAKRAAARGFTKDAWRYATMITLVTFAEVTGMLLFVKDLFLGRGRDLIEYK